MKVIFGLYLIALGLFISSCQKSEPETYLIPADFTGKVQIIFNQNGTVVNYKNAYGRDTIYRPQIGKEKKYDDGRRIYEIPADGILLTQFKENDGFIDRKYFLTDKNEKKTPLKKFELNNNQRDTVKWAALFDGFRPINLYFVVVLGLNS